MSQRPSCQLSVVYQAPPRQRQWRRNPLSGVGAPPFARPVRLPQSGGRGQGRHKPSRGGLQQQGRPRKQGRCGGWAQVERRLMTTVGHPTAPRRRTVQQWRQHAASQPCCVGCRRGGGDSPGAGAAVRGSGGNGASSGASSTAAERGGGPTHSCRPPWEGKGSAAGILCHSQRIVQRQQQRRRWGGWRSGNRPSA
jgi:hypothetical protein